MAKRILSVIIVIMAIAAAVYYVIEITLLGVHPSVNIFRLISAEFACVLLFLKLNARPKRPLAFYKSHFKREYEGSFRESAKNRKRLLIGMRLFDMEKYGAAIKKLKPLFAECTTPHEHYAVGVFLASSYKAEGMSEKAISVYREVIRRGGATSTVYSNLALIYSESGQRDDAIDSYERAIMLDATNAYAYNNLAQLYFEEYELDEAEKYAKKSLECNGKMQAAASLLSIIYALRSDSAASDKYFHIALTAGASADELRRAIAYYKRTAE